MIAPARHPTTAPGATGGPWRVVQSSEHHGFYIEDAASLTVCDLYCVTSNGKFAHFHDAEQRAPLIAAAPDLRDALDALLFVAEANFSPTDDIAQAALTAARSALLRAQAVDSGGGTDVSRRLRARMRNQTYRPPGLKVSARDFADALEENEEHMAEMAAMAVTCEQFGLTEEEGYDLLISLPPDQSS